MGQFAAAGAITWAVILAAAALLRPGSPLHGGTVRNLSIFCQLTAAAVVLVTIALCICPMGLSPVWNGERPTNRNQYELTAEAFMNGHLYMDYEVDPRLEALDNPYDMAAREKMDVFYQWDHAFYNGHYYMYFGVVPVVILFLPWRVLTGTDLTTYHATQIFATLFIIGVFCLFHILSARFFPRLPCSVYLCASMAMCVVSLWHSVAAPALYCTAIASGLCMEIWSLYFFVQAVWVTEDETKTLCQLFAGSLFGALACGCRPPVGLANLLILPFFIALLFGWDWDWNPRLILRLIGTLTPYVIIAALLMWYNAARFDNPFEFGQSYQLTIADQSQYQDMLTRWDWGLELDGLSWFLFGTSEDLLHWGTFVTFPVLLAGPVGWAGREIRRNLKRSNLLIFTIFLTALPVVICLLDVLWTPVLGPRSRMDINWLLGLLAYLMTGFYYVSGAQNKSSPTAACALYLQAVCMSVLLFLCPNDGNFTDWYGYGPELALAILTFGSR